MKSISHKSIVAVVRERERELHFSKTKYSFINYRFEEDSNKNLKN